MKRVVIATRVVIAKRIVIAKRVVIATLAVCAGACAGTVLPALAEDAAATAPAAPAGPPPAPVRIAYQEIREGLSRATNDMRTVQTTVFDETYKPGEMPFTVRNRLDEKAQRCVDEAGRAPELVAPDAARVAELLEANDGVRLEVVLRVIKDAPPDPALAKWRFRNSGAGAAARNGETRDPWRGRNTDTTTDGSSSARGSVGKSGAGAVEMSGEPSFETPWWPPSSPEDYKKVQELRTTVRRQLRVIDAAGRAHVVHSQFGGTMGAAVDNGQCSLTPEWLAGAIEAALKR